MLTSKLPNVGVTIFTQMSALAQQHEAINLSQGFPNFDCDPFLKQQVNHYVSNGLNQYAPMTGLPQLQQAIANLANKQTIADNANTAFMDADATLQSKYTDVSALYEGALINDATDINAMLVGLTSPDDDAKINALNEVLTARTNKSDAFNALEQANLELSQAQTLKDATPTEYNNA